MSNIIDAIINLVNNPVTGVESTKLANNRTNMAGDALEEFVKDLFANTFGMPENERMRVWNKVFSYLGNSNNPPDSMLKGGDTIEVKKVTTDNGSIPLNSSHPKQKLKSISPLINNACRTAENWTEKDMIYAVGVVKNKNLKRFCMIYGLDYCAEEKCYLDLKQKIKDGVMSISSIDFAESKEIGHVNKVDPLGITYLRVRGMWGIDSPWKVFNYIYQKPANADFDFMCLINEDKWATFDNTSKLVELEKLVTNLNIKYVQIKNPDNPAQLKNAKLITFIKESKR